VTSQERLTGLADTKLQTQITTTLSNHEGTLAREHQNPDPTLSEPHPGRGRMLEATTSNIISKVKNIVETNILRGLKKAVCCNKDCPSLVEKMASEEDFKKNHH